MSDTGQPANVAPNSERMERLYVAQEIVKTFAFERFTYLALSALVAVLVIVEASITIHNKDGLTTFGLTLLGSGGVVAFNIGRLLKMFTDVLQNVFGKDS